MGPWARLAAACAACPLQWQTDVYWKVNEQSGPSSAAAGGPKYCGTSWPALQGNCETATECRSGSDADCPTGQKCFGDVECRKKSPATRPPTRPPTRYPTRQTSSAAYSKPPMRPPTTRPVSPAGDIIAEVVGGTHNAVAARPPTDQPVMIWADNGPEEEGGGPAGRPTVDDPSETQWRLTNDLYLHGILRASYYCGARFRFDASTCATARPCPAGHHGDCPEGEHCFPDTPCGDLIDGGGGGGDVAADDSAPSPSGGQRLADGVPGQFTSTCTSNDHCPFGQFCAASLADGSGSCRSCLVGSGMGCSTDEFCRTRTCSDETEGEERCYSRDELDLGCRVAGLGTACDVERMECVEDAKGDGAAPVPPTGRPTRGPTRRPSGRPTGRPSSRPTRPTFDFSIVGQKPPEDGTGAVSASYCGTTWASVNTLSGCMASVPCPRGDECPPGSSCVADSRCPELLDPYGAPGQQAAPLSPGASGPTTGSVEEVAAMAGAGHHQAGASSPVDLEASPPGGGPAPSPAGDWTAGIQQKPFGEQQQQEEEEEDGAALAPETFDATAEASVQPPRPDGPCTLCPGGASPDPDAAANFQGRETSCAVLDGVLASNAVAEGTGLCGNYRSQFSGVCCPAAAPAESEGTASPEVGDEVDEVEEDARRPDQHLNGFDATSWYTESERSGSPGSAPIHVPLVLVAALFLLER